MWLVVVGVVLSGLKLFGVAFFAGWPWWVVLAPFALWQWQSPGSWQVWAVVLLCGFAGGLGHLFAAMAHRYASAAVLGPFLYQQILFMGLWGWLVFNQLPDTFVVAGAAVVIASGLLLLALELRQRR